MWPLSQTGRVDPLDRVDRTGDCRFRRGLSPCARPAGLGELVTSDIDPFDLDAAMLRKSASDIKAMLSALAARLEGALPGRVKVEWKRDGLFSAEKHVTRIAFDADDGLYVISMGRGEVETTLARKVRGVAISTKTLAPGDWLSQVRAHVAALADHAGRTGDSLNDFL